MLPGASSMQDRLFHLRRRYQPRRRMDRHFMDIAPWVDVALLVMLYFMIHAPFVLRPGIELDLPVAPMTAGAPYGSPVVTISNEGLMFFNDERTTMSGLASGFQRIAETTPDAVLIIEADTRIQHLRLVEIYNMATQAGIHKVILATRVSRQPAGGG